MACEGGMSQLPLRTASNNFCLTERLRELMLRIQMFPVPKHKNTLGRMLTVQLYYGAWGEGVGVAFLLL